MYARIGTPYCPNHHTPIVHQSIEEMTNKVMNMPEGTKLEIMAPIVRNEKGTHKDILDDLRKEGYSRVRVNGTVYSLDEEITLEKMLKIALRLLLIELF